MINLSTSIIIMDTQFSFQTFAFSCPLIPPPDLTIPYPLIVFAMIRIPLQPLFLALYSASSISVAE